MIKYLLIIIGILSSSMAQIMQKKASVYEFKDFNFFLFLGFGGLFYLISFGLYAIVLKYFPISKLSPVMAIGVMIIVIIAGIFVFNEKISVKQAIGIIMGISSIYLILG